MSTVQDSLIRQQFSMITSSLLQSLRITYSFTVMSPQLPTVPIQQLPQCNQLQRNNLNCI